MSRCARTRSLLDARFAEIDLTRDQAAHVATCAECARAFAVLRRFDADLESIGRDLAPERAGDVHDLIEAGITKGGSTVSWRNALIGVAAVAIVLVAILGASFLGDRSRPSGVGIGRAEAAAAFGVPGDALVMVGGDAVGLRVTGDASSARLELLLMAADEREVRQVYEHTLGFDPDSAGGYQQLVRCSGVLERDIYAIIAMGWPADRERVGMGGVPGEGTAFPLRGPGGADRVAVLFVAIANEVEDDSVFILDWGGAGTGSTTIMGIRDRLGPGGVSCAHPATARCGDWEQWAEGTRASITRWLVEARLEAVRVEQQLGLAATEDEVVMAAVGSIDKNCQLRPPDTRLMDIANALYD